MFQLTSELVLQGLTALFLLLWAGRDALRARKDTLTTVKPNPMVAAMSMAWDRDMQERFLQLMERIAEAAEKQATSQDALADGQRNDMTRQMDKLLEALTKREEELRVSRADNVRRRTR